MSAFSGKQYKGAMKDHKRHKRAAAKLRALDSESRTRVTEAYYSEDQAPDCKALSEEEVRILSELCAGTNRIISI